MKVSVITVTLNAEDVILHTLVSVTAQDHPDIEHIIIDGGSTDRTMDIISQHGSHLTQVVTEPDHGIYDAMNKGLELASGDIICFLNSDDHYASRSVLSRIVTQMRENRLDALISDVAFFNKSDPERIVRRYRSGWFTPKRLAWGWMPAHPGLFLSKAVTDRVGHFKTDYSIAGDYEYIVRAFHNQNLSYQHFPEIAVKMQTGGVSTSGLPAKIKLNREVLRACRENGIKTNILKILSKYPLKTLEILFN